MKRDPAEIMERAGVKPTSNRLIVLRALLTARTPVSLVELETELETLERSSILRVLTLFSVHGVVHSVEDGRGVTKYEICHGDRRCSADDMHPHFYCERCMRVVCMEHVHVPQVEVPAGFMVRTVNYMLKGLCPDCVARE